ncbi:MAG: cation transporter [Oscillospiraceae bacterium]|nr:cation transporter [Oscillospiraceae bacterium]
MKKAYDLKGEVCANCAAKIEEKIKKLDGVSGVTVNFITAKLIIEAQDDKMPGIIESAKAVILKYEPDALPDGM